MDIAFVHASGASSMPDRLTHEKTLPWAVFAQSVKGWYEISVNNGPVRKTEPGGAFLVPANHRMRITHRAIHGKMEINWVHIQASVFSSIDPLSFYRLPVILTPAKARPIGALVRNARLLKHEGSRADIPGLFRLKAISFEIMRRICECGVPVECRTTTTFDQLLPLVRAIKEKLDKPMSVADMARLAGVSVPHLHVLFRETFKLSPHNYLFEMRIKTAGMKLLATNQTIQEIAYSVGFDDPYHFSRVFKRMTGLSPLYYREQRQTPGA